MEILDTIGDTPLVKISDNLYAKLELYKPNWIYQGQDGKLGSEQSRRKGRIKTR